MSEQRVLASCLASRKAWTTVLANNESGDFSEVGNKVLGAITKYYERDSEAENCDPDIVGDSLTRSVAADKHKAVFEDMMTAICAQSVSPENVAADYIAQKREVMGAKLATAILSGTEDLELLENYVNLTRAETLEENVQEVITAPSLVDFLGETYKPENMIQLLPSPLNKRLGGGLLRGHHLIAFARVEMGKTMMCVNWIYGFLKQGLTVLYASNEDKPQDLLLRVCTRFVGKSKYDVLDDLPGTEQYIREFGYENLHMLPMSPGSPAEIEEEARKIKPDVIIVDQLRNLNIKDDNYTLQLDKAAKAIRAIGQRHNALMISITQAGDSARNKSVLDDGDIDYSNTGVPAACDVLLGLGGTVEEVATGRRTMSLPKNKPGDNHDAFPVKVDTTTSKILGVV